MINDSLSLTLSSSSSLFATTPPSIKSNNYNNNKTEINNSNNNSTPILSDLLNTSPMEYVPFVIDFTQQLSINDRKKADKNNKKNVESPLVAKIKENKRKKTEEEQQQQKQEHFILLNNYNNKESLSIDDYFLVEPEHTHGMELTGMDNCLFLAMARSFLSKFYFENKKYEFIIRLFCFNNINSKYNLNSDVNLQQILRKKLCLYWLSFVQAPGILVLKIGLLLLEPYNIKVLNFLKRKGNLLIIIVNIKIFTNVYDYIYQIYQIGVNNFSDNKLFELFALEDLAELFDINITVFNLTNSEQNPTYTIYKPSSESDSLQIINDYVHLSFNRNNKIKYKLLMSNVTSGLIRKTLLNPVKTDDYFLKVNANYSNRFLLIDSQCLFQCFGETLLNTCLNVYLFSHFLSECSVHLLISLKDLNFDDFLLSSKDPNEMINYLNQLWGQNHFSLKDILKKLDIKKEIEYKTF